MEEDKPRNGYEIKNSSIPILLSIRPISTLRPHEETVPFDLDSIVRSLQKNPVLRHPIIADLETGLVLDGTHRLAALKALGCRSAPCALINYQDDRIRIERWFRLIMGSSLDEFRQKLAERTSHSDTSAWAEECLAMRRCYASLADTKSCWVFPSTSSEPPALARLAFEVETLAREAGLRVKYLDNKVLSPSCKGFILSTIKLEKKEIVDSCLRNLLFPPKTTRHVIPSRPLGTSTPLEWLEGDGAQTIQRRFVDHLKSLKVKRLPEGSKVGSRRYQEEVFVFE